MMTATPQSDATSAYYRAAILGLRALEAREARGRRFSPDADARWARFRGKLHDGDRLNILLRDASAPWGIAFAASHIFRLNGVAIDEPFGPAWEPITAAQAKMHLAISDPPTLDSCASVLGIERLPVDLPEIRPAAQYVVAGGAAILALADAFNTGSNLDWSVQVTVIADIPAHRQLAGLASLFVGAVKPCSVLSSDTGDFPSGHRIIGPDAEPACVAQLGR